MNENVQPKPNNHMVMAIISTVLSVITCTFVYLIPIAAGIVSIVYASQVNSKYDRGDQEGAESSAKIAKISWIVAIVTIVLIYIGSFLIFGASLDEMMEIFEAEMEKQRALQE
jgi:hypothetical protein